MGFKCGIVGLPNVGKSTLFNALTETAAAQAANYPFCTIEPNVGEVAVPDPRLEPLAALAKSAEIIPTRLTFVDIAGLVRGASKGEGLGNQFLGNIREVDAIAHVVRCFEDPDVTHVENRIDPIADIETIETELMLADLDSLEKRVDSLGKKAKGGDKEAKEALDLMERALTLLRDGKPARLVARKPEEEKAFHMLGLLTSLPVWDATTGSRLATLSHEAPPDAESSYTTYRALWSPDERYILTISGEVFCNPDGCDHQARVYAAPWR
jgi:GTP-binding protein YchF